MIFDFFFSLGNFEARALPVLKLADVCQFVTTLVKLAEVIPQNISGGFRRKQRLLSTPPHPIDCFLFIERLLCLSQCGGDWKLFSVCVCRSDHIQAMFGLAQQPGSRAAILMNEKLQDRFVDDKWLEVDSLFGVWAWCSASKQMFVFDFVG